MKTLNVLTEFLNIKVNLKKNNFNDPKLLSFVTFVKIKKEKTQFGVIIK